MRIPLHRFPFDRVQIEAAEHGLGLQYESNNCCLELREKKKKKSERKKRKKRLTTILRERAIVFIF